MQFNILGTRGIPALHGGFETFAEKLAPYLVDQGHDVVVYCQPKEGQVRRWDQDQWNGVQRRHFRPRRSGATGTMEFDLACVRDVLSQPGTDLVLGYNTAVFNTLQRLRRRRVLINMDGIEWKRAKWSIAAKTWFYINEVIGANMASVAIADHPQIARHVARRCFKTPVMIPYGSDVIDKADPTHLDALGVRPNDYLVSIARIEPENSILEMVEAFSALGGSHKLVVLGNLEPTNAYHRAIRAAASDQVALPGAIYDPQIVRSLRFFCRAYLHGHQVGGTNPSLVEALGAGNAVIAHDNRFNRWVAGDEHFYFVDKESCTRAMQSVFADDGGMELARRGAKLRHAQMFRWDKILKAYEDLLVG